MSTEREVSYGGVVVRGDDVIVIVPRGRRRVLGLPKGGPNAGESPEQTAAREVREETGVEATVRDRLGQVDYTYRRGGRQVAKTVHFYLCEFRGGDTADQYFARTECVAGVQDMRFQELMPDVLHWLGVRKIHRLVSMSNMKYDAITGSGIEVGERVDIPDSLIPADARVEMDAKKAAGYFTPGAVPDADALKTTKGRTL